MKTLFLLFVGLVFLSSPSTANEFTSLYSALEKETLACVKAFLSEEKYEPDSYKSWETKGDPEFSKAYYVLDDYVDVEKRQSYSARVSNGKDSLSTYCYGIFRIDFQESSSWREDAVQFYDNAKVTADSWIENLEEDYGPFKDASKCFALSKKDSVYTHAYAAQPEALKPDYLLLQLVATKDPVVEADFRFSKISPKKMGMCPKDVLK